MIETVNAEMKEGKDAKYVMMYKLVLAQNKTA